MSKYILTILLFLSFFRGHSTKITMTVSGGNINNLTNAQSAYGVVSGDTLLIPGTLTNYCGIGGIVADSANPIVVVVAQRVTPFQLEVGNCTGVKFYFKLNDSTSGMVITGASRGIVGNGVKWKHVSFFGIRIPNPSDYPVFAYHSRTYNGTKDSTNYRIIFDSVEIYGGVALIDGWNFNNNGTSYLRGIWDSVTFRNIYMHDMQGGNVWSIQHFFHGKWENILVRNTGTNDTRHVGVIHFGDGNGKVDRMYCYNTYGNKVRWKAGTSFVRDKNQSFDTCMVTNCIFVKSPKYPGMENNSDPSTFDSSSQWIRGVHYFYANINIGRFTDSDYTDAATVVDDYVHYGFLKAYNILCWDMDNTNPLQSPFIHIGDGSPSFTDSARLLYGTAAQMLASYLQDTVQAVTKVNSAANRTGVALNSVFTNSQNGQDRRFAITWDVGAFQWSGRPVFTYRRGFLKTKSGNAEPEDYIKHFRIQNAILNYLINLQNGENVNVDSVPKRLGF